MKSLLKRAAWGSFLFSSVALGQPTLTLNAVGPTTINPTQTITTEVFVNNVVLPDRLRAYQATLRIVPQTGATGTLVLVDPTTPDPGNPSIFVDQARPDWVFASVAASAFSVADPSQLRVASTLLDTGSSQSFSTPKYCGTLIFRPGTGALGNFRIEFMLTDPLNPEAVPTFLLSSQGSFFPMTTTSLTVTVATAAANDLCANAQTVPDGATAFTTALATTDGPTLPTSCDPGGANATGQDVWFNYTATCSGILTVGTCGSATFDTRVAVYSTDSPACACPTDNTLLKVCNDNGAGCAPATTSEAFLPVSQGNCYKIRIGGAGSQTGSGTLTVTCMPDVCNDAKPVAVPSTTVGSTKNVNANDNLGLNCGQGVPVARGAWFATTGTGRLMTASLCSGTTYNSRLTVYQGGCVALTCVADVNNTCGSQEQASWCSTAGTQYFILVHGISATAFGGFTLALSDQSCDDANACTDDSCSAGACVHANNYDSTADCCRPSDRLLTPLSDGNPCTSDLCNPATGVVTHPSLPNGPNPGCEDGFVCTRDTCNAGVCQHTDINTISCFSPLNCPNNEECVNGFCDCIGITMEVLPQPGVLPVAGCYASSELFEVRMELGPSAALFLTPQNDRIVGAQFFLDYDATTLDFISAQPGATLGTGSPFSLEIRETVNESTGRIDYLVGVTLGGEGAQSPTTMAVMTFRALNECTGFIRFRPPVAGGQRSLLITEQGTQLDPDVFDAPLLKINAIAPQLTACPANVVTAPDAGQFTATINAARPTATDSCDPGSLAVVCTPDTSAAFATGTEVVTCSSTDSCGLQSACSFNVTVQALSCTMSLQLSRTVDPAPFSRCITFEAWDCDAPGGPLRSVVEQTFTFSNSTALGVNIPLPGSAGRWDCMTARDKLHTLRSTAANFTTSDNLNYTATYQSPRAVGGHWLVGGNLNDDSFIDIIDFAIFFPRYLSPAVPNTPCGTAGPDANVNGDAVVDLLDLVFVTGNSLLVSEANCCGLGGVAAEPVTSITVEQLREMGMEDSAAADLTGDGVVDWEDIRAFFGGDPPGPIEDPQPPPVRPKQSRPIRRIGTGR